MCGAQAQAPTTTLNNESLAQSLRKLRIRGRRQSARRLLKMLYVRLEFRLIRKNIGFSRTKHKNLSIAFVKVLYFTTCRSGKIISRFSCFFYNQRFVLTIGNDLTHDNMHKHVIFMKNTACIMKTFSRTRSTLNDEGLLKVFFSNQKYSIFTVQIL